MKKILLLITILTLLFSCKKEEPITNKPCNCGTITDKGIDSQTDCYWLEIQNECTGSKALFCFEYSDWMNNSSGNEMCIDNVSNW